VSDGNEETRQETTQVTFDEFSRIDVRAGTIVSAERVPKADRLLRLEVALGELGTRTIVAGLAESYTPESLVGRRTLVVVNLAPRKLRGTVSHGMLLAGERSDTVVELASCLVPDGTRIG